MAENREADPKVRTAGMKVTVCEDGPLLVTGSVPLYELEITHDREGYAVGWKEEKCYPPQETYSLCRCGNSHSKPFCDGTHAKVHFDGILTGVRDRYRDGIEEIDGPNLTLTDKPPLCVHARFCQRAGGTWNLTRESDNNEAREMAIDQAGNCPSGRLVTWNTETGDRIEPEFSPSIAIIENSVNGEHGPVWVRGGIPVECPDGTLLETRNRVTLCRCGKSCNKPLCDGSHLNKE